MIVKNTIRDFIHKLFNGEKKYSKQELDEIVEGVLITKDKIISKQRKSICQLNKDALNQQRTIEELNRTIEELKVKNKSLNDINLNLKNKEKDLRLYIENNILGSFGIIYKDLLLLFLNNYGKGSIEELFKMYWNRQNK